MFLTDFGQLITDLQALKINVATECDVSPSTISSIKKGGSKDPRHSLGQKILLLHRTHCPELSVHRGEVIADECG